MPFFNYKFFLMWGSAKCPSQGLNSLIFFPCGEIMVHKNIKHTHTHKPWQALHIVSTCEMNWNSIWRAWLNAEGISLLGHMETESWKWEYCKNITLTQPGWGAVNIMCQRYETYTSIPCPGVCAVFSHTNHATSQSFKKAVPTFSFTLQ